jgi:hypothetical protein
MVMTPVEAQEVLQAYGAVLAERAVIGSTRDVRSLPYAESRIKEALQFTMRTTSDSAMREHLKVAYVSLAEFQELTDKEVNALQNLNRTLAKNPDELTIEELRREAKTRVNFADKTIEIQRKSAVEAEALASGLKASGL